MSRSIADLQERTAYEVWLLEEVYRITDASPPEHHLDAIVYPADGGPPTVTNYGYGNINLGDWRPGLLEAGAPLILVTAFKLLDMAFEWVLGTSNFRFAQKIGALRGTVQFPFDIASRPWLQQRLVALYAALEPLRGTIIHGRHFTSAGGAVSVAGSKKGLVSTPVSIAAHHLRRLAMVAVTIVRTLEGALSVDELRELRLRRWLDELRHLHGEPSLGQLEPALAKVRLHVLAAPRFDIDLARVRADVVTNRPGQHVLFDIRVIVVEPTGPTARAFLVPWSRHKGEPATLSLSAAELEPLECPLPSEVDVAQLAAQLANMRLKPPAAGAIISRRG
jgi:hypothetical protein